MARRLSRKPTHPLVGQPFRWNTEERPGDKLTRRKEGRYVIQIEVELGQGHIHPKKWPWNAMLDLPDRIIVRSVVPKDQVMFNLARKPRNTSW